MYKNEILDDLWHVKEEIVKENDYDVRKLCESLNNKTKVRLNVNLQKCENEEKEKGGIGRK